MMRPFRALLALLLCLPLLATAQDYVQTPAPARPATDSPRPWRERIWFGGGIGLGFGTVTNIGVEPMVGYKVTRNGKLSAGIGGTYQYFRDARYSPAYESSVYGGRLFGRYRIIEPLFAHVEYSALNYELYAPGSRSTFRQWVPFLLVGGGYSARVGGGAYLTATVLWDVIQDENSPYASGQPWIGAGVGFGF